MEEHVGECRTLFVRKIPQTVTNESLSDKFSEIGPVKRAFVIKEKGETEKNRGFGYVTYSFRDDAVKAMETIKEFGGRKIFISFADRRNVADSTSQDKKQARKPSTLNKQTPTGNQPGKYMRAKTVVVSQFPKNTPIEKVKELAKSLKKVVKLEYEDPETNPKALMHFKSVREAKMAMRKLDNSQFKGVTLKAIQQSNDAAYIPRKVLKMRRLIIRNLSFKTSVEDLKKTFEKFGEVLEAVIPSSHNRSCGFGFVQFLDIQSANRAIQEMNAKKIDGRVVAIDWAISKTKFDEYKQSLKQKDSKKSNTKVPDQDSSDEDNDDDDDNDGGGGEKCVESDDDEEEEAEEEEDSDESAASIHDSDVEDVKLEKQKDKSGTSDDDDDGSEEDDDDSEEDDGDDEDEDDESDINDSDIEDSEVKDKESNKKAQADQQLKNRDSDVNQGRTIFIRNVPFSCTEAELTEIFSKYGDITYCTLVKKDNIPRGSAFIQFVNKEVAGKCLETCGGEMPKEKILTGGRQLFLSSALSREQVANLKTTKAENIDKDGRNLHLAREGLIRVGMKAAEGLTKLDLNKRMKAEMRRRQRLKDPDIFVSATRLCVQNIPTHITDRQLKDVFVKAASDKKCVISECRIMRDMERTSAEGVSRSLGYGFVNFKEHQHALNALRYANNNPDIFGASKRLIVEFSLENKKALEIKQKRLDRSKQVLSRKQKKDTVTKKDIFSKKGSQQQTAATKRGRSTGKSQKQKIMPSHLGPKNRHRDRGVPVARTGKRKVKETRIREFQSNTNQNQKTEKRKTFSDNFDSMVAKYKKKMLGLSS